MLFVWETMVKKEIVEQAKDRIDFSNAFGVSSVGRSGGLCIYWSLILYISLWCLFLSIIFVEM